jgi:hypothetical protein
MSPFRNTVIALIIAITTTAGAVAGYFIGMQKENRRLNELLRETHAQLTTVIQDDATAGSEAIRYRQQGADGLLTAFGRNQNGNSRAATRQQAPASP